MSDNSVLISVGIPVRNGAITLERALQSILDQTYKNIEIIISDNNSSDETEKICKEFAIKDCRIAYYKQEKTITALENFQFVFEKSQGKYFMWAADDDLRSNNYIEVLLNGFQSHPEASIIFSDTTVFKDIKNPNIDNQMVSINDGSQGRFDSQGLSFIKKHIQQRRSICVHIYGLINSKYLYDYPWLEFDIDFAPDFPILHWLLCHGDFIYVYDTTFYYFQLYKSPATMALANSLKPLKKFPLIRFSHCCAQSIIRAETKKNPYFNNIFTYIYMFFFFYYFRTGGLINILKNALYTITPSPIQMFWRRIKKSCLKDLSKMAISQNDGR